MSTIIILFLVRVVLPITVLLTLGEWIKNHNQNYWHRM